MKNEKPVDVRFLEAYMLGKEKTKNGLRNLRKYLSDDSSEVRLIAAHSIGKVGNKNDTYRLISLLRDKDKEVATTAVKSLGKVGDTSALPHLRGFIITTKDHRIRLDTLSAIDNIIARHNKES